MMKISEMRKIGCDETMIAEELQHQKQLRAFYKAIVADGPRKSEFPNCTFLRPVEPEAIDPAYSEALKWLAENPED